MDNELVNLPVEQGNNFLLSYNVSSNPVSHLKWWRSKNGISYELIGQCSPKSCNGRCEQKPGKEYISNTSFEIKDLKYPEDEYVYKCNASNTYGNDSKKFELKIYGNYNIIHHLDVDEFILYFT